MALIYIFKKEFPNESYSTEPNKKRHLKPENVFFASQLSIHTFVFVASLFFLLVADFRCE